MSGSYPGHIISTLSCARVRISNIRSGTPIRAYLFNSMWYSTDSAQIGPSRTMLSSKVKVPIINHFQISVRPFGSRSLYGRRVPTLTSGLQLDCLLTPRSPRPDSPPVAGRSLSSSLTHSQSSRERNHNSEGDIIDAYPTCGKGTGVKFRNCNLLILTCS